MRFVRTAITDADVILYVTDVVETSDKNEDFISKLSKISVPVIVAINKTDLSDPAALELLTAEWKKMLPKATIIPISALYKQNLELLFNTVLEKLPEGPVYYPDDSLTTDLNVFLFLKLSGKRYF